MKKSHEEIIDQMIHWDAPSQNYFIHPLATNDHIMEFIVTTHVASDDFKFSLLIRAAKDRFPEEFI